MVHGTLLCHAAVTCKDSIAAAIVIVIAIATCWGLEEGQVKSSKEERVWRWADQHAGFRLIDSS